MVEQKEVDLTKVNVCGVFKRCKDGEELRCHQRKTFVVPTPHHYEETGENPYIKYTCPVCDIAGNRHQVIKGSNNCPLCNVNLLWEWDLGDEDYQYQKGSFFPAKSTD